jgi:DASS family divalent anion:Na+ symporter
MAETIKSGINYKKLIGGILGVVAVVISRAHPPDPLNLNLMMFLGTFACAVTWWVVELMPDYATCLLMCTSWVMLKVVPFTTAFSSFSGETFWLLLQKTLPECPGFQLPGHGA